MSAENGCEDCLQRFIYPSPCFHKKQEDWIVNCSNWKTRDVKWRVVKDCEDCENDT